MKSQEMSYPIIETNNNQESASLKTAQRKQNKFDCAMKQLDGQNVAKDRTDYYMGIIGIIFVYDLYQSNVLPLEYKIDASISAGIFLFSNWLVNRGYPQWQRSLLKRAYLQYNDAFNQLSPEQQNAFKIGHQSHGTLGYLRSYFSIDTWKNRDLWRAGLSDYYVTDMERQLNLGC